MAFNYGLVEAPVATIAREAAQRIKLRLRRSAEDIVAIGLDLIDVKASIGHGNFLPWIDAEFAMSEYSARNFMHVAEVYGKRGTVPDLPPTALYELAAPKTPIEVREEVERMIEAGEVVTKDVVEELRVKLASVERAKEVVADALDDAGEKVSKLESSMNELVSVEVDATAKRIADDYRKEIDRLNRELAAALKRPVAPTNVVGLHKPLTPEEIEEIDSVDDEFAGADFNETASPASRAMVVAGCIRSICKVKADPRQVYEHLVAGHVDNTVHEHLKMVSDAISLLNAVKELANG